MNRKLTSTLCALTALALTHAAALAAEEAQATTSPTAKVVAAADAFLATLDAKQQAAVVYPFDDDRQRARWSNFPTGIVTRGGLCLKDLSEPQRAAAMAVVQAALSERGYEKVRQIMDGDEYLKSHDTGPGGGGPGGFGGGSRRGGPDGGPRPEDRGGNGGPQSRPQGADGGPTSRPQDTGPRGGRGGFGRGGPGGPGGGPGGGLLFGSDLYYLSFVGKPSATEPWMLQFGGHHLALNLTIVGDRGVLTPSLTAAQPASYPLDGKTVRPLGAENDKAFALLNALDDGQRKQAILNYHVGDLVLGPEHDGETIQPEGLKVSTMTDAQRAMLLDLIGEWANLASDGYAAARMDEIKAGLGDTWFAWSGPTTVETGKNGSSYYRIQGPKLVIEYAPQMTGGDPTNHVHTIYRDPTNDYGRALTAK